MKYLVRLRPIVVYLICLKIACGLAAVRANKALNFIDMGTPRYQGQAKPELVLFLVHGFSGNETTFFELDKILESVYQNNVGTKRVWVQVLRYDTENQKKSPRDFTNEIHDQILEFFWREGLAANTPYGLIVHSQGGIVAHKLLYRCVVDKSCAHSTYPLAKKYNLHKKPTQVGPNDFFNAVLSKDPGKKSWTKYWDERQKKEGLKVFKSLNQTPDNVQLFVSLGTPFWGSSKASKLKDSGLFKKLSGLPQKQLEQLANSSLGLTYNRKNMLRFHPKTGAWRNPLPEKLQVYNIIGDISEMENKGLLSLIRADELEFDVVVDVTSARMDFIYYIEDEFNKKLPGSVLALGGQHVRRGKTGAVKAVYPTKTTHIPLNTGEVDLFGLTKNVWSEFYRHGFEKRNRAFPALEAILDGYFVDKMALPKVSEQVYTNSPRDFHIYSVDLRIKLPSGYKRKVFANDDMIKKHIKIFKNRNHFSTEVIGNSLLSKFYGGNFDQDNMKSKAYQSFFHSGKVIDEFAWPKSRDKALTNFKDSVLNNDLPVYNQNYDNSRQFSLFYRIDVPGWKQKDFSLNVSPSWFTYAEVFLRPYLPVLKIGKWPSSKKYRSTIDPRKRMLKDKTVVAAFEIGAQNPVTKWWYIDPSDPTFRLREHIADAPPKELRESIYHKIKNNCHVAHMGALIGDINNVGGFHQGHVYRHFADKRPMFSVNEYTWFEILGRFNANVQNWVYEGKERPKEQKESSEDETIKAYEQMAYLIITNKKLWPTPSEREQIEKAKKSQNKKELFEATRAYYQRSAQYLLDRYKAFEKKSFDKSLEEMVDEYADQAQKKRLLQASYFKVEENLSDQSKGMVDHRDKIVDWYIKERRLEALRDIQKALGWLLRRFDVADFDRIQKSADKKAFISKIIKERIIEDKLNDPGLARARELLKNSVDYSTPKENESEIDFKARLVDKLETMVGRKESVLEKLKRVTSRSLRDTRFATRKIDRYLVTSYKIRGQMEMGPHDYHAIAVDKGLAWVNVVDVDIHQNESCALPRGKAHQWVE